MSSPRLHSFFATLCLVAVSAFAQDSLHLDFDAALKIVIKNNADVQEAKYTWMAETETAAGAYGDFEPHLVGRVHKERAKKPSAMFTETRDEYKLGVQGKLPTGTEYDIGFNQANYTHNDLTSEVYFGGELRQHILKDGPLYFTPTSNLRKARFQRDLAYHKYREALSDIMEKFCDAYWNYYYTQQLLDFSTKSAQVAKDIMEDAQKRFQLGILSALDHQKTIAEFSDREAARLEAQDQLRNARLQLLLVLSSGEYMADSRPISITPDSTLDSIAVMDSLTFIDSISITHPAILSQSAELSIREEELDQHKTSMLPKLDVIASYGIRSRDKNARIAVRDFKHENTRQKVLAGGIEIDVPLLANIHERHQIAAEKSHVRSARARLALLQNKLFEEYRILQKRAQEIREQWKYGVMAVDYHKKELEEEFKKLALGKSNYHEIFESEEDLRKAQQRHLENMRTLRVIDIRLARAKGKLLLQTGLEQWNQGSLSLHEDLLHE
ncbi:MAG: TolC family protein [Fibrobacter sp.]|nr:TolC family protein [Fibrobacter sp.]